MMLLDLKKFLLLQGIQTYGVGLMVWHLLLNFSYKKKKINLSYELMELNMSRKVKLNNFYAQSLIKKQKLKEINKINCEQSGVALNF